MNSAMPTERRPYLLLRDAAVHDHGEFDLFSGRREHLLFDLSTQRGATAHRKCGLAKHVSKALIERGTKKPAKAPDRLRVRIDASADIARRAVALDGALDILGTVATGCVGETEEREHHLRTKIA